MYGYIGLSNIPGYFYKIRSLLDSDRLFLNHAISRGGKRKRTRFSKRPEQRALQKYIFPGGELDDIGHTVSEMEIAKLEVHDVEGWRRHYQRTTQICCERLSARRTEAEAMVGTHIPDLGVLFGQGVAAALPPSRADLYEAR